MTRRYPRIAAATALALSFTTIVAGCSAQLPTPSVSSGRSNPTQAPATPSSVPSVARPKAAAVPGQVPKPVAAPSKADQPDRPTTVALPFIPLKGIVDPPAGTGMDRYTNQTLVWSSCDFGQCASILAPMDYDRPDYKAITVQLSRKATMSPAKYGSLLMNPGGPGAAGREMPTGKRYDALTKYDLIGWDPRGAGASTPVVCFKDQFGQPLPLMEKQTSMDASPDTDAEAKELDDTLATFSKGCAENSGEYLKYIGTAQTVQDMDLIRQLLGEPRLNYLGYSYGTYLGSYYASKYPDKVGRMVLDSAVNVTDDQGISQATGFDRALWNFAGWLISEKDNSLGSSAEEVVGRLKEFLDKLDSAPLKTMDANRPLTQALAVQGIVTVLYGSDAEFVYLKKAIQRAYAGDGSVLLSFADAMNGRNDDGTWEELQIAFPSILCVDWPDAGVKAARDGWKDQAKDAPFFGFYFGPGATCASWPVRAATAPKITAPSSATKILVVGSTGDPATPYEFAQWMSDQLGNAEVLTYDGFGHGTFGGENACINSAVTSYLQDGTVPAPATVCKGK
ncbi:MAG: alpha/beta fold hydrolase [Propionibacteriaceae bacterium]